MSWQQISLVVDKQYVQICSELFEGFLAQAVTTQNAGDDAFYEIAFPGIPDWQKVKVTALFDSSIDSAPIINFVVEQLTVLTRQEIPVSVSKLLDQDWERVWLDSFKPIQVGHQLWVCPSWCEPTVPEHRNIFLDPGLAFGTGTHATTHLCLQWLSEQCLDDQEVLDYGSGSGILAIAALLSGASFADAVDIDPLAVMSCRENASRNNLADKLTSLSVEEFNAMNSIQYQLVIANILADVIISLKDTLINRTKSGGCLLLTGILSSQVSRVNAAFADQFSFQEQYQDDWCLLIAHKIG